MIDRRRLTIGVLGFGCSCGLIATALSSPSPRLVWNASASAPVGLYRASPGSPVRVGDIVLARPPSFVRSLAARRHYLPLDVPLVKRVVAVAGARVCASGNDLTIDDKPLAHRLARDRRGRSLPAWQGCRTLKPGDVFLAMTDVADSFDGRYFGPTAKTDLISRVVPLWVR